MDNIIYKGRYEPRAYLAEKQKALRECKVELLEHQIRILRKESILQDEIAEVSQFIAECTQPKV